MAAAVLQYKGSQPAALGQGCAHVTVLDVGQLTQGFSKNIKCSACIFPKDLRYLWLEFIQGSSVACTVERVMNEIIRYHHMKDSGFINSGLIIPILQRGHSGKGRAFVPP